MSKSLIQTANQNINAVTENGVIPLGTVVRRFGCNLALSGNGIEVRGEGYYTIDCTVTVAPTATGDVSVALYKNGVQVPSAIASGVVATASDPITLPIVATIRQGCACCNGADTLTVVLLQGAGAVTNISTRVVKA